MTTAGRSRPDRSGPSPAVRLPWPASLPVQAVRRDPPLPLVAQPAFWMLALLLTAGTLRIGGIMVHFFTLYPGAASLSVVLFSAYAVPFLLLLRQIDYLEREPVLLQVVAFSWGGLVATSTSIAGGTALADILAKLASPQFAARWGPAVAGAGVEEGVKVLGLVAIALVGRARIKNVVDGLAYGALIGLGFQVTEDIVYAMNALTIGPGTDQIGPVVATFLVRGFLGGLWSHTLFSALAGAGVAYALVRRDRSWMARLLVAVSLCGAAWGFHFAWNSPVLADGFGFGVLGVIASMLLKGVPALLVGVALVVAAERRQADYYSAMLAGLGDHRVATHAEIVTLVSPRRRVAARRQARARLGRAGAHAVRRLQRTQAQLAVAMSRGLGTEVLRQRREVLARRHELVALAMAVTSTPRGRHAHLVDSTIVVVEVVAAGLLLLGLGYAIHALASTWAMIAGP